MVSSGLVQSPLATTLLELAARRAHGAVDVAGRRVLLEAGEVRGVEASATDENLVDFMVHAGTLSSAEARAAHERARAEGVPLEDALAGSGLGPKRLAEARRAVWVDRLARGLTEAEEGRDLGGAFVPLPAAHPPGEPLPLLPLLLEALALRAAEQDAGRVGEVSAWRFVWRAGPHLEQARPWSRLGDASDVKVGAALARDPRAASRIAALVRAGLADLVSGSPSAPPPPPRPATLAPAPLVPAAPAPTPSAMAPAPLASLQSLSRLGERLPPRTASLEDPLDAIEQHIASVEQTEAPGPERAAAWRAAAEVWEDVFGSITEAVRAYREAAAADPDDPVALARAAELCGVMGDWELASAYAEARVRASRGGPSRTSASIDAARVWHRQGRTDRALTALRASVELDPDDLEAREALVELLESTDQRPAAAVEARALAAKLDASDPLAALEVHRWAHGLSPREPAAMLDLGRALARAGFSEAAMTLLSDAAAGAQDEARQTLVLEAAQVAEAAGRSDLAAELLMDAFDREPDLDVFYELSVAHLELAGMTVDLGVMLEAIAAVNRPGARSDWLARAGQAFASLPTRADWARELFARALAEDPGNELAREGLAALAPTEASAPSPAGEREASAALRASLGAVSGEERAPLLLRLAALLHLSGDPRGSAEACLELVALRPDHEEAIVRLDRAARSVGTVELRRRALAARLSLGRGPRHLALTYSRMAQLDERQADLEPAVEHAAQAARVDPRAADALSVLVRQLALVPRDRAVGVAELAREVLGDPLELALPAAEAARRAGAPDDELRWLAHRANRRPRDEAALRRFLACTLEGSDVEAIAYAADRAAAAGPGRVLDGETLQAVTARLEALGAVTRATELVVGWVLHQGVTGVAPLCVELASRCTDRLLAARALEVAVALERDEAQLPVLRALARTHRERGAHAAEARMLLRQLALGPDDEALARLSEVYAETGEAARLEAVLALRLEGARDAEARRRLRMDLAAAALFLDGDAGRARAFVEEVLAEVPLSAGAALDGAEGLLALGEAERALSLLLEAARRPPQAGEHPDAAGHLFARALELIEDGYGDAGRAMDLALEGLRSAPSNPTLLTAFERLALARGDVALAIATYDAIAAAAFGRHGRRGVRYRQARWLEAAGAPRDALAAYLAAFELNPGEGVVFTAIERLARALGDHEALAHAVIAIAEASSHVERRMALIERAADILVDPVGDYARAFALVADLWKATGRSDLVPKARALAGRLAAQDPAGGAAARGRILETLEGRIDMSWDGSDKVRCLRIVGAVKAEDLGDLEGATAAIDRALGIAAAEDDVDPSLPAEAACDLAAWLSASGDAAGARSRLAAARALCPSLPRLDEVERGFASGASSRRAATSSRGAALEAALEAARQHPEDPAALRALAARAREGGDARLVQVTSALLSSFDTAVVPVDEGDAPVPAALPPAPATTAEALLAILGRSEIPTYRRSQEQLGGTALSRVTPEDRHPLARALRAALETLGADRVQLFLQTGAARELHVVVGYPPSIVASERAEARPELLHYRVARAVALASHGRALLGGLEPAEATVLLGALSAAFGPPKAMAQASRAAANLAGELWRVVPAPAQVELRALVAGQGLTLDRATLFSELCAAAAVHALRVDGRPGVALRGLAADEPTLRSSDLGTEEGYRAALLGSPPLRALVVALLDDAARAAR